MARHASRAARHCLRRSRFQTQPGSGMLTTGGHSALVSFSTIWAGEERTLVVRDVDASAAPWGSAAGGRFSRRATSCASSSDGCAVIVSTRKPQLLAAPARRLTQVDRPSEELADVMPHTIPWLGEGLSLLWSAVQARNAHRSRFDWDMPFRSPRVARRGSP